MVGPVPIWCLQAFYGLWPAAGFVNAALARASLEGIREIVAFTSTRSNIAPSSLSPQQLAAALWEAFLGMTISDQETSGVIKAPVPDLGIQVDDFQEMAWDDAGLSEADEGEGLDDDGNDADDDCREVSK